MGNLMLQVDINTVTSTLGYQHWDINTTMATEVEETLKRLVGHKGVIGTVVVNKEGACIKSTLDPSTTSQYSSILGSLVTQATTMFKEVDPGNDVTFMRVRTKKCQFMVVLDNEYLFIVVQNNLD